MCEGEDQGEGVDMAWPFRTQSDHDGDSANERLARIETLLTVNLPNINAKVDSTNHRLDQVEVKLAKTQDALNDLRVGQARAEANRDGRDQVTTTMSNRDKTFIAVAAVVVTLAGMGVSLLQALIGK